MCSRYMYVTVDLRLNIVFMFVAQLRSSFTKAFSRGSSVGGTGKKSKAGSVNDVDGDAMSLRSDASVPNSPMIHGPTLSMPNTPVHGSSSNSQ